ncbi:MAG TPA: hypothetical protein VMI31_02045 [Fimbriimonadaceae bacterium]|nr:hypothetical protein [Fimbriimonadaceae bacterium]
MESVRTANLRAQGFIVIIAAMAVGAALIYEARAPLDVEQTMRILLGQSLAFLAGLLARRGVIYAYLRSGHRWPVAIAADLLALAGCYWGYRFLMHVDRIHVMSAAGAAMFVCGGLYGHFLGLIRAARQDAIIAAQAQRIAELESKLSR